MIKETIIFRAVSARCLHAGFGSDNTFGLQTLYLCLIARSVLFRKDHQRKKKSQYLTWGGLDGNPSQGSEICLTSLGSNSVYSIQGFTESQAIWRSQKAFRKRSGEAPSSSSQDENIKVQGEDLVNKEDMRLSVLMKGITPECFHHRLSCILVKMNIPQTAGEAFPTQCQPMVLAEGRQQRA